MTILLLTGPPASGKSTVLRSLSDRCAEPLAVIEVDQLQHMIVDYSEPWEGEVGSGQQFLAVHNAIALAQNFDHAGFHVAMSDVVTTETAAYYREELTLTIVRLLPNWEQTMIRAHSGNERLRFREREALYAQQRSFEDADYTIDNSVLPPIVVAGHLARLLEGRLFDL